MEGPPKELRWCREPPSPVRMAHSAYAVYVAYAACVVYVAYAACGVYVVYEASAA